MCRTTALRTRGKYRSSAGVACRSPPAVRRNAVPPPIRDVTFQGEKGAILLWALGLKRQQSWAEAQEFLASPGASLELFQPDVYSELRMEVFRGKKVQFCAGHWAQKGNNSGRKPRDF